MKLAIVAIAFCLSAQAKAQHDHGKNSLPDWYDPGCCNQRDCHPIEDSEIEFRINDSGDPIAIYKPTQNIFGQRQWLKSQDERYHVCINRGNDSSLCLYIPTGV